MSMWTDMSQKYLFCKCRSRPGSRNDVQPAKTDFDLGCRKVHKSATTTATARLPALSLRLCDGLDKAR
ncbi:hypothetical protein VTN77DRAFT_5655 [Rasamsonia byssochlamydoides]|uniref:uncharacterized protein n=1 Tax=Rasamsonia byssochlamydoides TaxID=89139 RepID=UPI0037429C22